jgi:hypothetical protein
MKGRTSTQVMSLVRGAVMCVLLLGQEYRNCTANRVEAQSVSIENRDACPRNGHVGPPGAIVTLDRHDCCFLGSGGWVSFVP